MPRDEGLAEADLGDEIGHGRLGGGEAADDPEPIDVGKGLVNEAQLAEIVGLEDGVRDRAPDVRAGGTQRVASWETRRRINGGLYQSWLMVRTSRRHCQGARPCASRARTPAATLTR